MRPGTGKGVRIAVLDSGFDPHWQEQLKVNLFLNVTDQKITESAQFDANGHGTACVDLIRRNAPEAEIAVLKVFDENLLCGGEIFLSAMRWCLEHNIDIINLSLGTINRIIGHQIISLCKEACDRGKLVVAAANQEGYRAYPAGDSFVFTVAAGKLPSKSDYSYDKENGCFLARGDKQKAAWSGGNYSFVDGASFAAANFTGILARYRELFPDQTPQQVKKSLAEGAVKDIPYYPSQNAYFLNRREFTLPRRDFSWIRKAALFPYNKEMHALTRFAHLLPFQIAGIYDIPRLGQVGRDAGTLIGADPAGMTIENFNDMWKDPERFDTVIIGYLDKISSLINKDMLAETVRECFRQGKNIFSFAEVPRDMLALKPSHVHAYCPLVEAGACPDEASPSPPVNAPVVGIFGTSSSQGKFTAQLALREKFLAAGYRLGQLGTEPHAELFGMDACFPYGYGSTVRLPRERYFPYLKKIMAGIDTKEPDLIIVGAQGGFLPYQIFKINPAADLNPITFLWATLPDAYILAINAMDDPDYVRATINALEGLGRGKVLALVISDYEKTVHEVFETVTYRRVGMNDLENQKNLLAEKYNLPVLDVVIKESADKLLEVVENYFGAMP
ncbi:MAG: S8 family serine peptidase [Bacillota bacterium]